MLGLLSILAAGGVVLALFLAPSTPDLVVHNAAGEVPLADSVTIVNSQAGTPATATIHFTAPDHVTIVYRLGARTQKQQGSGEAVKNEVFAVYNAIGKVNGFVSRPNDHFVADVSTKVLVNPQQSASVAGRSHLDVQVREGYPVVVRFLVNIVSAAGANRQSGSYRILQVNGARVSSS